MSKWGQWTLLLEYSLNNLLPLSNALSVHRYYCRAGFGGVYAYHSRRPRNQTADAGLRLG